MLVLAQVADIFDHRTWLTIFIVFSLAGNAALFFMAKDKTLRLIFRGIACLSLALTFASLSLGVSPLGIVLLPLLLLNVVEIVCGAFRLFLFLVLGKRVG